MSNSGMSNQLTHCSYVSLSLSSRCHIPPLLCHVTTIIFTNCEVGFPWGLYSHALWVMKVQGVNDLVLWTLSCSIEPLHIIIPYYDVHKMGSLKKWAWPRVHGERGIHHAPPPWVMPYSTYDHSSFVPPPLPLPWDSILSRCLTVAIQQLQVGSWIYHVYG